MPMSPALVVFLGVLAVEGFVTQRLPQHRLVGRNVKCVASPDPLQAANQFALFLQDRETQPWLVVQAACVLLRLQKVLRAEFAGLKVGRDIEIRPIPRKGNGVIATRRIKEGRIIGRYKGRLLQDRGQYEDGEVDMTYVFWLGSGPESKCNLYLDGKPLETSNWTRYINHSGKLYNLEAEADEFLRAVYFKTLEDIEPGTELCFDYGEEYVQKMKEKGVYLV